MNDKPRTSEESDLDSDALERMLEHRHATRLSWCEPYKAMERQGVPVDAHVEHRATVHDCVNMARLAAAGHGATDLSDKDLLANFIVVHWAEKVKIETMMVHADYAAMEMATLARVARLDAAIARGSETC